MVVSYLVFILKNAKVGIKTILRLLFSIFMANGTWTDVEILFEGLGTASKPITLKAKESCRTTKNAVKPPSVQQLKITCFTAQKHHNTLAITI
jgi:hypothetical protein